MKTPPLIAALGLQFRGMPLPVQIAGRIILAIESDFIRLENGYIGGGGWHNFHAEVKAGTRPRWEDFAKVNAGGTRASFAIWGKCKLAVISRLRTFPRPGTKELLALMERRPSTLTADERQGMLDSIMRLGLREGDTFEGLRMEFRYNQPTPPSSAAAMPAEAADAKPAEPAAVEVPIVKSLRDIENLAIASGVSPARAFSIARIIAFNKTANPPLTDLIDSSEKIVDFIKWLHQSDQK
jgi:hypothetical protein